MPTQTRELLFAVVEAHGGVTPQAGFTDDTVAVVGLDGIARTRAAFQPRIPPQLGNAIPVLPQEAHIAAGQVFYIDGKGVVRALTAARGALPRPITAFGAVDPQGYESYAVSPDGQHLIASIDVTRLETDTTGRMYSAPDHDAIEAADASGTAHTLYMLDHPDKPLFIGGWDAQSPIGLTDPRLATQNGVPHGWASPAVRLDPSGHPGAVLGPASCRAIESLADGTILCTDYGSDGISATDIASVHGTSAGDWTVPLLQDFVANGSTYGDGPHLSSGGRTVVFPLARSSAVDAYVMSKGGSPRMLVSGFSPQGFLDADTIIGTLVSPQGQTGNLATVQLSGGGLTDLGFRGLFVGVVQQAA